MDIYGHGQVINLIFRNSSISSVEESEVTSSINVQPLICVPMLCPCESVARLDSVTQEEADLDLSNINMLEHKLLKLLSILLGEKRMVSLGHPGLTSTNILEKVLRLTGTTITSEDDLCTESCKVLSSS